MAGGFTGPDTIAALASTDWGSNPEMVRALADQAARTRLGVGLLVLSVVLNLPTMWAESTAERRHRRKIIGWLAGGALALILWGVGVVWARWMAASFVARATEILKQ